MAKASGKQRCPHCGEELDTYRNPVPTVDLVIEVKDGIVLVERKNDPKGWALPGGFVDYGESLEAAAIREAKEETGLKVELIRQFHTYSDPHRDPRQHNLSTVFIARARGKPKGGDDAKRAEVFTEGDLPTLVFDHRWILEDYFAYMRRMRPLVERRAK
ncbi:MAG: NUDIX hydrolase [Armatimonadetes bacterium CG_4_10_14_3_um_filter_66_18]|nr:NUDIX hydrolase [Armatimonadota bacterium]OIP09967.1 MAG: NUDIX hydrolase [Armatimonadetes bacterium CG2_30_66_41]PIU95392.1 MAG: NUDIX hydrolase [Armatimonadetes bacterium CG06_land_8_20_14_3_00_66_21]PIW12790.1 MAG: NUDIX hydrolase [Armatimonadetes bacterium CG17_big_fil_post_rev_8_21_14_2_50_66_6]PIX43307.1 MAG: NUDIX hydrolase [Armatimonadetes bacterium CG_4_8_14_3_um_filter_66_20]PIY46204.1 MAG: NUDIX hydrolase [Armatimonadetes bacterium CG_4_10_14_3_um_filter_66_18]PIZ31129.1 MAG: NU